MSRGGPQSEGANREAGRLQADDKSNPPTPAGTLSPPALRRRAGPNEMGNSAMQFK